MSYRSLRLRFAPPSGAVAVTLLEKLMSNIKLSNIIESTIDPLQVALDKFESSAEKLRGVLNASGASVEQALPGEDLASFANRVANTIGKLPIPGSEWRDVENTFTVHVTQVSVNGIDAIEINQPEVFAPPKTVLNMPVDEFLVGFNPIIKCRQCNTKTRTLRGHTVKHTQTDSEGEVVDCKGCTV